MIAKGGTGGGFGGVLGYVLDQEKGAEVLHQQELFARAEDRALLLAEMRMCAEQNLRCTKPVYHLSLSWAAGDNPTPAEVVATAQRFLRDLGLQEHQALVVRHHDTAHEHVHIVVNRVHPDTGKTWKTGLHHHRLHPICRRVERDMGWTIVPSRRMPGLARPTAPEQTAERKRGVEPLAKRINRECGERLSQAATWRQLERTLQAHGYALATGGRRGGLAITDGKRQISASRVQRDLSRPKLEKRFGMTLYVHRKAQERIREIVERAWERGRDADLGL